MTVQAFLRLWQSLRLWPWAIFKVYLNELRQGWVDMMLTAVRMQGSRFAFQKLSIGGVQKAQCVLLRGALWHRPCKVSGYKFEPDATSQARSFSCALRRHGPKAPRTFSAVRQKKHIGQEDVPKKREAWMAILTVHSYYRHENQCIFQAVDGTVNRCFLNMKQHSISVERARVPVTPRHLEKCMALWPATPK